jgi:hypothetical protein
LHEVENFQFLTMIFFGKFSVRGNFSSSVIGLELYCTSAWEGRKDEERMALFWTSEPGGQFRTDNN